MAEISVGGGSHKKGPGVKKSKKLSTRVDLTPMVDLGFLLITFFIFTTTMSKPVAMKMNLPKDVPDQDRMNLKKSCVITVMPARNNQIYYYEGDDLQQLHASDFKGIRDVLLNKKARTDPKFFFVILKPTRDASYRNTVNILDEMTIDHIEHYAMVDISPQEDQVIGATQQVNGLR